MDGLENIAEDIRAEFEITNSVRDEALARSRVLTRHCANTIKAIHRKQWDEAQRGLETIRAAARELKEDLHNHPDIYYTGYTQDALKEYVESFITYALVRDEPLPTPQSLAVPGATYLNGTAEAASELRRSVLDIIRHGHSEEAERLLDAMDSIYNSLMAFDFPDAITYGLRRRVDSLRNVLQQTRGDLTNSLRRQQLQDALVRLEKKLGMD